jgi:CRISPR-associated protein Cmr5
MKAAEKYFKKADDALKSDRIKIVQGGSASKEFKGYISAFGAAVVMSGLLPAMAFYVNPDSNAQEDRPKVIEALAFIMGKNSGLELLKHAIDLKVNNKKQFDVLQTDVINAAIALKLMLRTYKLN